MKIKFLIMLVLAAVAVACSDSLEDRGRVDMGLIQTLSRDGSVSTYVISDFNMYEKDTTSNKWEVFDYKAYDGFKWPDISSNLCFQDGCLWESVVTFSSSNGPVVPYMVWKAYCKFSGEKDKGFYVRKKFFYDENTHIMTMGNPSPEYYVEEFTEKQLRMEKIIPVIDSNGNQVYRKYTYRYVATEPIRFDGEDMMAFDSTAECYKYWVNTYREKYGRYLDMNEYYAGEVYLDNPIIDLDAVDEWIDRYEQQNL